MSKTNLTPNQAAIAEFLKARHISIADWGFDLVHWKKTANYLHEHAREKIRLTDTRVKAIWGLLRWFKKSRFPYEWDAVVEIVDDSDPYETIYIHELSTLTLSAPFGRVYSGTKNPLFTFLKLKIFIILCYVDRGHTDIKPLLLGKPFFLDIERALAPLMKRSANMNKVRTVIEPNAEAPDVMALQSTVTREANAYTHKLRSFSEIVAQTSTGSAFRQEPIRTSLRSPVPITMFRKMRKDTEGQHTVGTLQQNSSVKMKSVGAESNKHDYSNHRLTRTRSSTRVEKTIQDQNEDEDQDQLTEQPMTARKDCSRQIFPIASQIDELQSQINDLTKRRTRLNAKVHELTPELEDLERRQEELYYAADIHISEEARNRDEAPRRSKRLKLTRRAE